MIPRHHLKASQRLRHYGSMPAYGEYVHFLNSCDKKTHRISSLSQAPSDRFRLTLHLTVCVRDLGPLTSSQMPDHLPIHRWSCRWPRKSRRPIFLASWLFWEAIVEQFNLRISPQFEVAARLPSLYCFVPIALLSFQLVPPLISLSISHKQLSLYIFPSVVW